MGLDLYIEKVNRKELAYFRKYNFLIPFFEEYYDVEIENLRDLSIGKDGIKELISRCEEVLDNHILADKLLPTTEGFFFGNTEYNEYYYEAIKDCLTKCLEILPEFDTLESGEYIVFQIWYQEKNKQQHQIK